MTSLDIALQLAAQGLPVFPCTSAKTPAIAKLRGGQGFKDASTDPATIRRLWTLAGPAAQLVAVPTGEASGIDALDVDPRHDGDRWEAEHRHQLGETRIHQTMSGGRHWLHLHAPGVRNIQDGRKIAPGIDVRGSGGYIVFPPSRGYRVIHEADVAPWPVWLLDRVLQAIEPARNAITRPSYPAADPALITDKRLAGLVRKLLSRISNAPVGSVHDTLLVTARTLGGYAWMLPYSETELLGLLLNALPADPRPDPANERRTALAGLQHGAASPLRLEERPYRPRLERSAYAKRITADRRSPA